MQNTENMTTAQILRYVADYIEMSETPAKVKLGVKFKIKNLPLVNIAVNNIDRVAVMLGDWVTQDIIKRIEEYQKVTQNTDGDEILQQFKEAQKFFRT